MSARAVGDERPQVAEPLRDWSFVREHGVAVALQGGPDVRETGLGVAKRRRRRLHQRVVVGCQRVVRVVVTDDPSLGLASHDRVGVDAGVPTVRSVRDDRARRVRYRDDLVAVLAR